MDHRRIGHGLRNAQINRSAPGAGQLEAAARWVRQTYTTVNYFQTGPAGVMVLTTREQMLRKAVSGFATVA
ncbi:hypothetical protein SAMN04515648_3446 [Phyllobacterium sp. CL33Tsu]|nr:hypothetical protein SAMN04515648_3446 [Phyllobacterium sp. CL33Tsu]